jgi:hypothetical protein
VLAHDHLVLPWFCIAEGEWRNLPRGPGEPCAVKRFLCVTSLALWLRYEARLSPAARCFYEVLRERTPVRYWLDCDLPLTAELLERMGGPAAAPQDGTPAERCRDRLAQLLERHVSLALCTVMDAQPGELRVLSVNGDGGCAATQRISLHVIATGALLPDNEHAAAAVRLAVIDSIRAAARAGDDAVAAALALCTRLETTIDAVNTRNRLRRMTGHTKIGQRRNSAPLPRHASLPVDAFFVSGAAAAGAERVLQWRAPSAHSWPADGRERQPLERVPGANVAAAPAAHAAILAELRAIPDVRVRSALWPCAFVRLTHAPRLPAGRLCHSGFAAPAERPLPLLYGLHHVPRLPLARGGHARGGPRAGAGAPLRQLVRHLLPQPHRSWLHRGAPHAAHSARIHARRRCWRAFSGRLRGAGAAG